MGSVILAAILKFVESHPSEVQSLLAAATDAFTAYLRTLPPTFQVKP